MLIESKLTLNALAVLTQIFKIPYTSETVAWFTHMDAKRNLHYISVLSRIMLLIN